jgi:hypothetical protein
LRKLKEQRIGNDKKHKVLGRIIPPLSFETTGTA